LFCSTSYDGMSCTHSFLCRNKYMGSFPISSNPILWNCIIKSRINAYPFTYKLYGRCLVLWKTFSKWEVLLYVCSRISEEWKSNTNIILLQLTDCVHFALFIIVFSKPVFIKIFTFFGYKTERCLDYFLRRRFIAAFKFMKDTRCRGPPISRTFFI